MLCSDSHRALREVLRYPKGPGFSFPFSEGGSSWISWPHPIFFSACSCGGWDVTVGGLHLLPLFLQLAQTEQDHPDSTPIAQDWGESLGDIHSPAADLLCVLVTSLHHR